MLHLIHQILFYVHVVIGSLALIVFWLPLFAKKGSKNHVRFGQYFERGMYAVSLSGLCMSSLVLFDPIAVKIPSGLTSPEQIESYLYRSRLFAGFLLMLSVLVFCNVRQAILVLQAKSNREQLKTPSHLFCIGLLATVAAVMGGIGLTKGILLFNIFAALSFANAVGMLYYIYKQKIKSREWIISHMGNILGAGIATYTAFLVFGGSRLLAEFIPNEARIIFWILPGVIGVIATIFLSKKYRSQYKVA